MNGAVFHTSATMTAPRAAHGSVVHRIASSVKGASILLAMP